MAKTTTVHVTLSTFDFSTRPLFRVVREGTLGVGVFPMLDKTDYSPAGGTPLMDATVAFVGHVRACATKKTVQVGLLLDESGSMGHLQSTVVDCVNRFLMGLQEVETIDPKVAGKGFLVIYTDGEENSSRRHTRDEVAKVLSKAEGDGWVVLFLGSGIDGWAQGRAIGAHGQTAHIQTVSAVKSHAGTRSAMAHVTANVASYLADSGAYLHANSLKSSRSVTEDGSELAWQNIAGPHTVPHTGVPGGAPFTPHVPGNAGIQLPLYEYDDAITKSALGK